MWSFNNVRHVSLPDQVTWEKLNIRVHDNGGLYENQNCLIFLLQYIFSHHILIVRHIVFHIKFDGSTSSQLSDRRLWTEWKQTTKARGMLLLLMMIKLTKAGSSGTANSVEHTLVGLHCTAFKLRPNSSLKCVYLNGDWQIYMTHTHSPIFALCGYPHYHCPHFEEVSLFQTKYFSEYLCSTSLSICFFVGQVDYQLKHMISDIFIGELAFDMTPLDLLNVSTKWFILVCWISTFSHWFFSCKF